MTINLQLVKVEDAHKPLGFKNTQQLYRVIREGQFPFPNAVVRFGKQIRINLSLIQKTMEQPGDAPQKVAA